MHSAGRSEWHQKPSPDRGRRLRMKSELSPFAHTRRSKKSPPPEGFREAAIWFAEKVMIRAE